MYTRPPVLDWTSDFDPFDARWVEDPFPLWDELRSKCPIAHTERFRGVYLPMRYEDIREIAYDTEHFSSRRVQILAEPPPVSAPAPPITSDPPHHRAARMILLPSFTPQAIALIEPGSREICRDLIQRIAEAKECDAAVDYAQHIPVRVIAHMLGLPAEDGDRFRGWVNDFVGAAGTDPKAFLRAFEEMNVYFRAVIAERRKAPGPDLISTLLKERINGEPLGEDHILGTLRLLLLAGIDTTWSSIGASLWHLGGHADDRRRLAAEPQLIETAIEEFLRAYAPVTMARKIVKDREVGGVGFKAGEMTLLCLPAANRDPAIFPDADKVLIDRKENRHAAFGLGIHRCVGSNLARMEMRVAIEEWLKAFPDFQLREGGKVEWSAGPARGPRRLPVVLGRG